MIRISCSSAVAAAALCFTVAHAADAPAPGEDDGQVARAVGHDDLGGRRARAGGDPHPGDLATDPDGRSEREAFDRLELLADEASLQADVVELVDGGPEPLADVAQTHCPSILPGVAARIDLAPAGRRRDYRARAPCP